MFFLYLGQHSNREKLGLSGTAHNSRSGKFFYNKFVTQLLFNNPHVDNDDVQQECEEKLARVAIVNIVMTNADAIVIKKEIRGSISTITFTGGLLSLYAGFSFLSLTELIFWAARSILKMIWSK